MQDGLHIGLAAWINQQQNTGIFVVCPASPIVVELVNIEAIQNSTDLARAAEFARLVNFIPRQGQVADVFSSSAVLWNVHRDILSRMNFATEPWTGAERSQYQAARDTLYATDSSGQPTPSVKFQFYTEMKHAYNDIRDSGGSQIDINQALANWTLLGYKSEVENALSTLLRLSSRSSRSQAEVEQASLQEERLRVSGELTFAPTYFAPLSALARQTWMEARASFDDLSYAVSNGPASDAWKAYRANRSGEVSFVYMVLHCFRPWYTPELYQADDWKFSTEGPPISQGNGTEGELPAYVDAVYLVSVKNVTIAPKPTPEPTRPGVLPRLAIPVVRKPGLNGIAVEAVRPGGPMIMNNSLGLGGPSTGVVPGARSLPAGAVSARALATVLLRDATMVKFTALHSGSVRRLTAIDIDERVTLARAIVARWRTVDLTSSTEDTTIYVAGFGCAKVPFSPNPNVNYKWS